MAPIEMSLRLKPLYAVSEKGFNNGVDSSVAFC
jgi:hypothetical protein